MRRLGCTTYGARYLDSKASRWLSADPAVGEYIPEAPVNEEARERNGKLPGMGGIYNVINMHLYYYAGNNPVKYTDPDGKATVNNDTNSNIGVKPEHDPMMDQGPKSKEKYKGGIDGVATPDGKVYKGVASVRVTEKNGEYSFHTGIGALLNKGANFLKFIRNLFRKIKKGRSRIILWRL
jgi:hypothetical protein